MSEFKGTPGPWDRWEQGGLSICKGIGNGTLQEVALVQDCSTVAEEEANADLISAAPDLLQALIQMVQTYPYSPPCHGWEKQVSAHKVAKEAIDKALGHAQP